MKLKQSINKLVKRAKKSPTFIFIGIILLFFSSIITIAQGGNIIKELYYKTNIGYKNQLLSKINKLNAGVNIGIFIEYFGAPTFKTKKKDIDIYEYVFLDDNCYYIQVLTDFDDSVLAYSVTTRDEQFNPKITIPLSRAIVKNGELTGDKDISLNVELGKTRFIELGEPYEIVSRLGAHDFYYSEKYYFGNPGLYQSYYFTQNEMGYIKNIDSQDFDLEFDDLGVKKEKMKSTDKDITEFRKNFIVNTYTVTAPLVDFDDELFKDIQFGPNKYQVRVIN